MLTFSRRRLVLQSIDVRGMLSVHCKVWNLHEGRLAKVESTGPHKFKPNLNFMMTNVGTD